jgi:hypothetical protein
MSMPDMEPFKNETESITLGQLTIENRLDQVELYGSLWITRDQVGLALALQLKSVLDAAINHLQHASDLPAHIAIQPTDKIDNPFK